jgi:GT2 family glycosyltransferase
MDSDRRNRLFLKYHKALDLFFPLGSKRRLFVVIFVNALLRNRGMGVRGFIVLIESFFSDLAEGFSGGTTKNNARLTFSRADLELLTQANITEVKAMTIGCSPNPRISIIIPAMNKWAYTYCCLKFISRLEDLVSFEVIIVDNGSTDQTKEMLALVTDISVIRNENNVGFVEACNMGVRASRGEYILFLNNDAMIVNGSLDNMVALMDGDRTIGAVGAKLVYPDGKLQEAGGIIWNDRVHIGLNYGKFENPWAYEYNYVREVDYCSGACLLVRKELFVRVGLFDAEFAPAYFEDTNLAFALRSIGYRTLYQPKAIAFHFEGVTAGTDVRKGMKQYQEINQKKFCDRWQQVLKMEHYPHRQNIFLARDRARFKKMMLYIDHDIPTFDKDAGSMITFEYLKLFLNMNIKIVFWPATLREVDRMYL